jgi:hypothetical protein
MRKPKEYQPPAHTHDEHPKLRCLACELEFAIKVMASKLGFEEITEQDVTRLVAYNAKFSKEAA